MNLMALSIMLALLVISVIRGKVKSEADRIFIVLLTSIALLAVLGALYSSLSARGIDDKRLGVFFIVNMYVIALTYVLFALYLTHLAGYKEAFKKRIVLWSAPAVVQFLVLTVFSLSLVLPLGPISASGGSLHTMLFLASELISVFYIVISFVMLWKIEKVLTILPAMMLLIWMFFDFVLTVIDTRPFLFSACLLYIYLSAKRPGILVHIGGILLAMFIMITLVIGNAVTSAAFSSYLKTIHDRNEEHLMEVEESMQEFAAIEWLMDYWNDNALAVGAELGSGRDNTWDVSTYGRPRNITVEQAEGFDPAMQLLFAVVCYRSIDEEFVKEFEIHKLDDLFLMVPQKGQNARILFDAKRSPDGAVRIGEERDVEEERREWDNYNDVVNSTYYWTWGNYSESDDFGFYLEIPMRSGSKALLCNSFKRSEIYAHLRFVSNFREGTMAFLMIAVAIMLLLVYLMMVRPILLMSNAVKRYRKDKDPVAAAANMDLIKGKNEIADLARDFSLLAEEMDRYTAEVALLAGEKERVNTELMMATSIQEGTLPEVTKELKNAAEFDIFASMNPAKEVGGDFYDFFYMGERHLAFLIADVSDKGVPAALFMMSAKNLINYRASEGGTPGEILNAVNGQLSRDNKNLMFVTLWMGILDLDTGDVSFACAGHEPQAIITNEGEVSLWESKEHNPAVGIVPGIKFTDYRIRLGVGDSIFLYTDGVIEAMNDREEFYGLKRMEETLKMTKGKDPEGIVQHISNDIDSFVKDAKQFDDMTMVCVKYYGAGG